MAREEREQVDFLKFHDGQIVQKIASARTETDKIKLFTPGPDDRFKEFYAIAYGSVSGYLVNMYLKQNESEGKSWSTWNFKFEEEDGSVFILSASSGSKTANSMLAQLFTVDFNNLIKVSAWKMDGFPGVTISQRIEGEWHKAGNQWKETKKVGENKWESKAINGMPPFPADYKNLSENKKTIFKAQVNDFIETETKTKLIPRLDSTRPVVSPTGEVLAEPVGVAATEADLPF